MSLNSIVNIQYEKRQRRKKMFNEVYEKIKIRINNHTRYGYSSCRYDIPILIYGLPTLNHKEIADYLETKLSDEGFLVIRLKVNSLYISWEEAVVKEQKRLNRRKKELKESRKKLEKTEDSRNIDLMKTISNYH